VELEEEALVFLPLYLRSLQGTRELAQHAAPLAGNGPYFVEQSFLRWILAPI
jgi:hypothetical protein